MKHYWCFDCHLLCKGEVIEHTWDEIVLHYCADCWRKFLAKWTGHIVPGVWKRISQ